MASAGHAVSGKTAYGAGGIPVTTLTTAHVNLCHSVMSGMLRDFFLRGSTIIVNLLLKMTPSLFTLPANSGKMM